VQTVPAGFQHADPDKEKSPKTDFLLNSLDFLMPEKSNTFVGGSL